MGLMRTRESSMDPIFKAAVDIVQNMPKKGPISISVGQKLRLYSLFKQGTIGQCDIPCPPFWCAVDRLKWRAWNSLGSMKSEEAKQVYIDEFKGIINRVQSDYDIVELARGSDERTKLLLKTNLTILGYDLSGLKTEADLNGLKKRPPGSTEDSGGCIAGERHASDETEELTDECSVSATCSDEEYVDVANCDHEQHSCWKRDPQIQRNGHNPDSQASLSPLDEASSKVLTIIEQRLMVLIDLLTYVRRIFADFLSHWNGSIRQFRNRWKLILFVIVWPFIANFVLAYLCYRKLTRW